MLKLFGLICSEHVASPYLSVSGLVVGHTAVFIIHYSIHVRRFTTCQIVFSSFMDNRFPPTIFLNVWWFIQLLARV